MKLAAPAELTRDTHFSPLSVHEAACWGFQPVNNGGSGWIVAGIFDFGLRTGVRLSTIRFLVLEFLYCRGSYRKSDWLYQEPLWLSASWSFSVSSNDFSTFFGPGFFLTVISSFAFFITTFYAMLESKKERCVIGKFYIQRRDLAMNTM